MEWAGRVCGDDTRQVGGPSLPLRMRSADLLSLYGREVHGKFHCCEFDPAQASRGDRLISPKFSVQDFYGHRQCFPVIVRSLLGNARTFRSKGGVCLRQNFLAGSRQFITANGISNTNRNPFCNRRTIAAVWRPTCRLACQRSAPRAGPQPPCGHPARLGTSTNRMFGL